MGKQAAFKTNPVSLEELLRQCGNGKIQLPDFQRSWVWDEERIKGLIASISQAFPVGALMTLEVKLVVADTGGADPIRREAAGKLGAGPLAGAGGRVPGKINRAVLVGTSRGGATLGAAGVEVAQQVLAETQTAILLLVPYLDALGWVFIAVALGGIAVTIYARLDDWKRGRR